MCERGFLSNSRTRRAGGCLPPLPPHTPPFSPFQAFSFCSANKRKTEFRRLCDTLRNHVTHLHRYGATASLREANAHKLKGWVGWTPESIELHLQTRFKQLSVASEMEQYSESFRTVEGIHDLMMLSATRPKSRVMATYYEQLSKVRGCWLSFLIANAANTANAVITS